MPIPIILGIGAAVAGIGGIIGGVSGAAKMKDAKDTMDAAGRKHEENIAKFQKQKDDTVAVMDALGKKEMTILSGFETFSQLIEKIQNRPTFKAYDKNGISVPKYDPNDLQKVSIGAGVLLGGLGSAAAGTDGGFAAAGATTAAVMALGTASTGTAISGLTGVAATKATLAILGGGTLAAGGGGIALGATMLSAATLGVGLLVGGIIFNVVGGSISNKADEAWSQMKRAEAEINKICKHLEKLGATAKRYHGALVIVENIYTDHLNKLYSIVETAQKTDWTAFSDEEKLVTENTVLLVGLLYNMCKVQLVFSSGNDSETNRINIMEINKSIADTNKVLGDTGLGEKDALAGQLSTAIQISSLETLSKIGRDDNYPSNGNYELTCDIDASGSKKGMGFEPISFNGTLEGNGFKISGLYINRGNDTDVGLFKNIGEDGQINGVNIVIDTINGKSCVGGLAGTSLGFITNCSVSGMVNGYSNFVGGLVGQNKGSIRDSCSSADVTGEGDQVGGLVGYMGTNGTITGCQSIGQVNGRNTIGGIVGYNEGNIIDSYSSGEVTGKKDKNDSGDSVERLKGLTKAVGDADVSATGMGAVALAAGLFSGMLKGMVGMGNMVGGLVGENAGNVSLCYSTGNVCGSDGVGGLAGYNSKNISDSCSSGEVVGREKVGGLVGCCRMSGNTGCCYSTGKVSGDKKVGGLVGCNMSGKITDSYSSGEVTGSIQIGGLVGENCYSCSISRCYSTGKVCKTDGADDGGGLIGSGNKDDITDSYWDVATSETTESDGGKGKITSKMQSRTLYNGWDFEKIWEIDEGKDYPRLCGFASKAGGVC